MFLVLMLAVYPAALLIAAATDLYEFKIPNWISLTLVGAYIAGAIALGVPFGVFIEGLLVGVAALAVGFALFAFRVIGGGDAKLLAAIACWIGASGLLGFLVNVAFAGGVLALALLAFRKTPLLPIYSQAPWIMRLHQKPKDIPYAVAIAAGGLLSFQHIPYFQLAFGG